MQNCCRIAKAGEDVKLLVVIFYPVLVYLLNFPSQYPESAQVGNKFAKKEKIHHIKVQQQLASVI